MPLINFEISFQLKLSKNPFLSLVLHVTNQVPEFKMTDTKLYIPIVVLSAQDNAKLLKQLQPGFYKNN